MNNQKGRNWTLEQVDGLTENTLVIETNMDGADSGMVICIFDPVKQVMVHFIFKDDKNIDEFLEKFNNIRSIMLKERMK